jgi:serine/threonine protein kinase
VSDSPTLNELVQRWQELQRQGRTPTPADLCRDRPELLGELEKEIEARRGERVSEDSAATNDLPIPGSGVSPWPRLPGYEILDRLGAGGMGVVYKARQVRADRVVAVKVLLAGGHADVERRLRFRAEAVALARLQHPNVVQVYEVGEEEGRLFFSMEWVTGGSLAQRLRGQPLPPAEAARLAESLARTLQAVHEQGILHRDLKPGNVLLTGAAGQPADPAPGTPKLADFGLAKLLGDESGLTPSGCGVGTPSYMAPEQVSGDHNRIGPAADLYGVGAILYEMLTGRPPFRAEKTYDVLNKVLHELPVPPGRLQAGVPPALEAICLKCLEKDARRRYASAGELADELRRWRAGELRERRWPPRVRWVVVIAILLGLAAAVGPGLVRRDEGSPDRSTPQPARGPAVHKPPLVLIGPAGPPLKKGRYLLGKRDAQQGTARGGVFRLSSKNAILLELLARPPWPAYGFEAEVCHEEDLGDGDLGITFDHSGPDPGPGKPFSLCRWLFSESKRTGGKIMLTLMGRTRSLGIHDTRVFERIPAEGVGAGRWRRLAVEVTAREVALFLDDRRVGTFPVDELRGYRGFAPGPAGVARGLGLWVSRGSGLFRNVLLRPIPGRQTVP